jgi:hypothetical protein
LSEKLYRITGARFTKSKLGPVLLFKLALCTLKEGGVGPVPGGEELSFLQAHTNTVKHPQYNNNFFIPALITITGSK